MVETAGGRGDALAPTVSLAELQQQVREAQERYEAEEPQRRVENAHRKISKIEAMLADAKNELGRAEAALVESEG